MSKRMLRVSSLVTGAAVPLALALACADAVDPVVDRSDGGETEVIVMSVEPATVVLRLGENAQLWARMSDQDGTPRDAGDADPVIWSSSRPDIVTVSDAGVLEARALGSVQISADCGHLAASASVTVVPNRSIKPPVDPAGAGSR